MLAVEEMLGPGAAGSAGPQAPSPCSQAFARGEARSPGTGGPGLAGWRRRAVGGRAEGANAEAVTTGGFCGAFQEERRLLSSRVGGTGGSGRCRPYKGTAPPSAGFVPFAGAAGARAANGRRVTAAAAAPKG